MTEEVSRLLPEGIGLIPLFLNVRRGTADEFETMMPAYERLIATKSTPPSSAASSKRRAATQMCADKGFLEEAQTLGIDMSPVAGDGILPLLARAAGTAREVIARYNTIGAEKK